MPIPKKEKNIDRRSAAERIYDTLLDWIIDGTLKPGEKLSVEQLAEYFDASRTPVREAIQKLIFQKIVKVYRNKMTCVAELETEDIGVWYRPLAALQPIITESAVNRRTDEHIKELYATIEELDEAIKKRDKIAALKADEAFHMCLLDMSGNDYVRDFFVMLLKYVQRVAYAYYVDVQSLCESVEMHRCIADAISSGDCETAVEMSKKNWTEPMNEFQNCINAGKAVSVNEN